MNQNKDRKQFSRSRSRLFTMNKNWLHNVSPTYPSVTITFSLFFGYLYLLYDINPVVNTFAIDMKTQIFSVLCLVLWFSVVLTQNSTQNSSQHSPQNSTQNSTNIKIQNKAQNKTQIISKSTKTTQRPTQKSSQRSAQRSTQNSTQIKTKKSTQKSSQRLIIKSNCGRNSEKHVDSLLAQLITFGDSGRKFPESVEQIPAYCSETKEILRTVESYIKKCTKALPKQVFSVYVFTIKSQVNQMCKRDTPKRREMLEAAKCVNNAKNAFAKCVDQTVDRLQRIKLIEDNSKKIPHLCCEYHDNKECNMDNARNVTECNEKSLEIIDRFVDSVAGNSLNILCGEFAEASDKCKTIGDLPENVKNPPKYKSFLIPTVEIIATLPH